MATMATGVIAAFVVLLSVVAEMAATAPPSTRGGCTDELLSFSACLSYVSSPPNNLTDTPSANCCDAFSSAVESGGGLCLCYFVRYPNILGFPLNTARLLSLSSICTPPPLSLNFLCSGCSFFLLNLPPVQFLIYISSPKSDQRHSFLFLLLFLVCSITGSAPAQQRSNSWVYQTWF